MSADYITFDLIKQSNTFLALVRLLKEYGTNLNEVIHENLKEGWFLGNDVLYKYLAKFENIDVIKRKVNHHIVKMIGNSMFSSKL